MMLLKQEDTTTSDNWKHSNPRHIAGFKPFLMAQLRAAKQMALFNSDKDYGWDNSDVTMRWNICIGNVWVRLPQATCTKIISEVCEKAGQEWTGQTRRAIERNSENIRGANWVYSIDTTNTRYGVPCVDISIFPSSAKIPNPDYDPQLAKEEEE